jgi:NADPH-dependent 7-cyano-7-deazaguanine reductase QueF-like protein
VVVVVELSWVNGNGLVAVVVVVELSWVNGNGLVVVVVMDCGGGGSYRRW